MKPQTFFLLGLSAIPGFAASDTPDKVSRELNAVSSAEEPGCTDSVGEWPPSKPDNELPRPVDIGLIVFPGFEMLDVYGPLDALRFLSSFTKLNLHILSTSLDPVTTLSPTTKNPQNSSFSTIIQPTHTFKNPPPLDMLLVPGGSGSRSDNITEHIDFIAETYPALQYILSVCTGAILTAKSGILDGKSATTNKAAWDQVIKHSPTTDWIRVARWVVDGNIWSSSGVSAGIDATLGWINLVFGTEIATSIANDMEYQPHKNSSWDPFADIHASTFSKLMIV